MENHKNPLSVQGLCKDYPAFHLQNVSFDLTPGAITGFIGRNGAGKTTTLNAVLSFVKPSAGLVRFWGLSMAEHAREIKEKIGFVSAGMTYYNTKKLKTITEVTRSFYPGWDDQAYRASMARFGLDESKTPAALSNGMKIKYALALALSHGAELLILDEPTSGLDPVSREELIEIFLALRDEGKTILFSPHLTADLEKCADRVLFLRNGLLIADQTLEGFADAYRLVTWEGELPADIRAAARGVCRVRDGWTALLRREDAQGLTAPVRVPTLDEIMVHLDREEETK